MQRSYESVVVIDSSLGDQDIEQEIEKITSFVSEGQGEVTEVQRWGRRKIAYEISGKSEGYYTLLRFAAGPELIEGLERAFRLNESVLRHLVLRVSGE
ncbi:MAG: 30S ribosomal protein S6 [Candidatus Eisenbacteria sp.]|nr:30S ribosomal protein S6 [Candidatus Eisenbacteria bacterium]